jgi:hypothetical protein
MYAELKGWNVIELYDLSGVSGKSVIDHPEAKRMLQDVTSLASLCKAKDKLGGAKAWACYSGTSLHGVWRAEATEKRSGAGEWSSEQAEYCKRSDRAG